MLPSRRRDRLRLQRLAELAAQTASAGENGEPLDGIVLDDAREVDLYRDALGPTYEQMIADRVPWPVF